MRTATPPRAANQRADGQSLTRDIRATRDKRRCRAVWGRLGLGGVSDVSETGTESVTPANGAVEPNGSGGSEVSDKGWAVSDALSWGSARSPLLRLGEQLIELGTADARPLGQLARRDHAA